jgi:CDP-paratose 2-epimerase
MDNASLDHADLNAALNGATVLVTGGAGFVGSWLASALAREAPSARLVAFDNLRRRGAVRNVAALAAAGVRFVHGDVRNADDVADAVGECDLIIDCAAEASASAGYAESPHRVVQTNLVGTINCLDNARRHKARVVFLSTSRVYPIAALNAIGVVEDATRWTVAHEQAQPGVSTDGVSERFTLDGVRTLYGATKLASELLLAEYAAMYNLRYVINRCGVITGPGQMGREEQGVFALWMARHHFGGALTYRGWDGTGKQVRDLLHVQDLWRLLRLQIMGWDQVNGRTYNVGGGRASSLSLRETTELCREISGQRIEMGADPNTHPSDVRVYVTDYAAVTRDTGWTPTFDPRAILVDLHTWMDSDHDRLARVFAARE